MRVWCLCMHVLHLRMNWFCRFHLRWGWQSYFRRVLKCTFAYDRMVTLSADPVQVASTDRALKSNYQLTLAFLRAGVAGHELLWRQRQPGEHPDVPTVQWRRLAARGERTLLLTRGAQGVRAINKTVDTWGTGCYSSQQNCWHVGHRVLQLSTKLLTRGSQGVTALNKTDDA